MAKTGSQLEQELTGICRPLLEAQGYELVELEYRQGRKSIVRLFIDLLEGPGGVTIEDCAKVSRLLGPTLDTEDLIPAAYVLEVSSPGLERPLTRPEHYRRFVGSRALVKPHEPVGGLAVLSGKIEEADDEGFTLSCDGKPEARKVRLRYEDVARANLEFRFEDLKS